MGLFKKRDKTRCKKCSKMLLEKEKSVCARCKMEKAQKRKGFWAWASIVGSAVGAATSITVATVNKKK